ncbi:uncharacterized protein FIBRA_08835 [Fibroporia radiculosa]|uniref:Uncharacterized protein n=1 Tax=Fibroporia radiculosa TaxID=599839 RepID=J4GXH3_9APHY|nr:uncharacterized protein FIBRA_08835 [Fibroporia radiculosa]CCM06560.1 predicted protein [Fibroporia radiculosa]
MASETAGAVLTLSDFRTSVGNLGFYDGIWAYGANRFASSGQTIPSAFGESSLLKP